MTDKHAKVFVGIVAAMVTAISIVAAKPAAATPDGCNVYPPTADCTGLYTPKVPVPGLKSAEAGNSCTDTAHFIFAASSTGEILVCQGQPARYIRSPATVAGVQQPGAPCSGQALAQSPDGSPLQCSLTGNGRAVWSVYADNSVTLATGNRLP